MTAPSDVRTCYRHPDRVSGISCQRCDRPICPQCMHQASVGFHCPECTKAGKQKVLRGAASWTTRPIVTQVLIGINVAVYLAMVVTSTSEPFTLGGRALEFRYGDHGLFADGAMYGQLVPEEPWRLLTNGFLHVPLPFGLIHIGLNMLALLRLGQLLEPTLGRARFIALYSIGLVGGSLGVALIDPQQVTIGASGAVFGLMGGAVMVLRERNIDLRSSGLIQTIGINLLITFTIPFISIGGHLGGLVGGFVGGAILTEGARRIRTKGDVVAAVITGAVAVAIMVVSYLVMV
ncbi:MAG TPA: rhomboid family intramembrane serine protease, partial [Iamia sp.]|nr:rhomboid family intramembrane serine protease [Iamia sp.]